MAWNESALTASRAAEPLHGLKEGELLDVPLAQLFEKSRLLDLIRNFVIFDGGQKKVPRVHQFLGIKAAEARIAKQEGGVIWHTQGSGKSILMVLLAKWLLEHDPEARVLIITDRDELDKQIEGVMKNSGVVGAQSPSPRISSRQDFLTKLASPSPRLLCSLLHKIDATDLTGAVPPVHGRLYVFVDECHRTQGGNMNKQMKRWLPNAIFIGFTGTPLLRKDKQTTRDVFGTYIHTYKFDQAVADKVVLDLKYEARNVPQRLTSQTEIDAWFERTTRGLNNFQKAVIRRRWATMEELMSAEDRKSRIAASIIHDFGVLPRLGNDRGTAMLVVEDIYDACHYFRIFKSKPFGRHCGLITSYVPNHNDISREPKDSDNRYKFDTYTEYVLKDRQTTKQYEDEAKRLFIEEPANMKLLIVVSKLLTGFDAPPCSYIYLDNVLRDHNLFQAICRTNRLDGDDKDYGHIVDFKELFEKVQESIAVYTSDELDVDDAGDAGNILVKDWLMEGKAKLDGAREALLYLCDAVAAPKDIEQHIEYFCGVGSSPDVLLNTEPLRISFYKAAATYLRAYTAVAQNLEGAGYSASDGVRLAREVAFYAEVRAAIKKHSGEELDIKPYEADMRYLINTYIQADGAQVLGSLGEMSLVQLIVESGIHDTIARQLNQQGKLSNQSVAEGIINNVRKTIIRDQLTDPRFYAEMSKLLEDLIEQKRESTEEYETFLNQAEALVKKMALGRGVDDTPASLHGKREATVIFHALPQMFSSEPPPANTVQEPPASYGMDFAKQALSIDAAMRIQAPAGWRGDETKERIVQNFLHPILNRNKSATLGVFKLLRDNPAWYV